MDCAFPHTFHPQYDPLIEAVREANLSGIREAGVDARMSAVGAAIQETMESYEVIINGKIYDVKTMRNMCGYSTGVYCKF